MDATIRSALAGWSNFYFLTGSAAAALTGLQFIVQSLLSTGLRNVLGNADPEVGIAAFGTPNVVHFTLTLLISAFLCAPWPNEASLRTGLSLLGIGGILYAVIVLRRTHRQTVYETTLYDWVWYVVLPIAAYSAVLLAALVLDETREVTFFATAAATLLLLCVGIHNAWDSVVYLILSALRDQK